MKWHSTALALFVVILKDLLTGKTFVHSVRTKYVRGFFVGARSPSMLKASLSVVMGGLERFFGVSSLSSMSFFCIDRQRNSVVRCPMNTYNLLQNGRTRTSLYKLILRSN